MSELLRPPLRRPSREDGEAIQIWGLHIVVTSMVDVAAGGAQMQEQAEELLQRYATSSLLRSSPSLNPGVNFGARLDALVKSLLRRAVA